MIANEPRDEIPPGAPARQRIAKLMARVGLCSRRDAEAWIVEGRVSVNGEVLTSPARDVDGCDTILVDGAPLPAAEKTRLFLFHKPRGLVTSDHDPEGRATVADYLQEHWPDGPRVVTIGRLDINTEGLLLLTNDGGLARILELPKTGWVRRYRVRAKGETDQSVLDGLRDGVSIEGVAYAGIEAVLDRTQGANVWLTMGLREGKNREVKRVLEYIGLEVNRLIRLSFGPFQLGDLSEGAVEEVRTRVLRDQLGTALAAAAGVSFEDAAAPPEAKPARAPRKAREDAGKFPHPLPRDAAGRDPRGGERPFRRGRETRDTEAPPPIRERPATGTRKHVSALRAAEAETARRGPRRRIERSDVTDRKDRTVSVERLVGARALQPTRARDGKRSPRCDRPDAWNTRPAGRQASPSSLAKRARTARSGARDPARPEERRDDARPPRRERPAGGRVERISPAQPTRDGERRPARPGGAPKRFETSRGDTVEPKGPHGPPSERPRDGKHRETRPAGGAPKRFDSDNAGRGKTGRPTRKAPDAATRPRDGERREARPDGAARRLNDKRAAGGGSRRAPLPPRAGTTAKPQGGSPRPRKPRGDKPSPRHKR